jgi:hypothetical protein
LIKNLINIFGYFLVQKPKVKTKNKPIKIPEKQVSCLRASLCFQNLSFVFQPTSSSSQTSSSSASPIQSIKNQSKPITQLRRSLSNMSLSSRYSYDNIDENEEYIFDIHGRRQRPLPPTPIDYHLNNTQIQKVDIQGDTASTTSAMTLRTESYRQAHPLQSFAFDYPKQPLISQSGEKNDQQTGVKKHYEISV